MASETMTTSDPRRVQLGEWLATYNPWDEQEHQHRDAMTSLARQASAPFNPQHLQPGHFTASAFVLSPSRSALLLIFHRKLMRWLQPGGHIENQDTDTLAAALREANEETGVHGLQLARPGIFDLDVHAIPARKDIDAHHHFDVRFLFFASDTTLKTNEEVRDARWVPLPDIQRLESDESVLRAVRKIEHLNL